MRFERDGWSVETAKKKGRPLPQWYLDEPDIDPINNFYLQAFYDLSTCRNIGQILGPIPWNIIVQYAEYSGLEIDMTDLFIRVMRSLDLAYLEWCNADAKRINKFNKKEMDDARFSNQG